MLRAPPHSYVFPEFNWGGAGATLRRSPSAAAPSCRTRRRRWILSATAGYKQVPLDTPGAYQMINEETGEKVIVWGGDDSPVPSPEVLSWKPEKRGPRKARPQSGDEATLTVSEDGSKNTVQVGASVGGFGRLKSQRIRALTKKSSKVTKENAHNNRESSVADTPLEEANGLYSVKSHKSNSTLDLLRQKHLHREMPINEKFQGTNSLHSIPKQDIGDADVNLSVSRVASSLHEQGRSSPTKVTDVRWLKQHRKGSADSGFFSRKSFKELGCSDDIIESLRSQMFLRPSHIQAIAYRPVLEEKSCIIADQSGSGKTLAYLAPIIQRLRQEELLGLGKSLKKSPRVLILVPTAELASQLLHNCRSIAKYGVPFRSMVATGGFRQKTQLDSLQQQLDVFIATPGRFVYLLQEGFLQLTNVKCVVLDEVDVLFGDEGFEKVLQGIISSCPVATQYLFVTATLPVDIYNKLVQVFPDCEVAIGPGMHRTSSGLEEVLVDCSGDDTEEKSPHTAFLNKKTALVRLVEESPVPKTIIFCNKIETCRKVENILKRFDRKEFRVKALPFHAALEQETRLSNMKNFLSSESNDSMFLICTDRASRGIDFPEVNHVILFDFPRDPSEYVRRVGRTARGAGGHGKAFVFVVGKQVSLARRIMERNKKGHPLHEVPSAYELERYMF